MIQNSNCFFYACPTCGRSASMQDRSRGLYLPLCQLNLTLSGTGLPVVPFVSANFLLAFFYQSIPHLLPFCRAGFNIFTSLAQTSTEKHLFFFQSPPGVTATVGGNKSWGHFFFFLTTSTKNTARCYKTELSGNGFWAFYRAQWILF